MKSPHSLLRPFGCLAIPVLLCSLLTVKAQATDYFIDSVGGNESNDGKSELTAWKTLTPTSKVNQKTFLPGDRVLFKRGCSWTGHLHLLGNGSSTAPLVVDAYGTGPAPIINAAGGNNSYAVGIWNKQYVTIQNLELTNDGTSDATRHGILVSFSLPGVYSGVKILNNNIHHVRGVSARSGMYNNAGIYVFIEDGSGDGTVGARPDNLLIEGNIIHDIKTIGIFQKSPPYYGNHEEFWATNMIVRDNVIDKTGADNIVIMGANAPLIEGNAGYDAGINGAGYGWIAGMWSSYHCKDATFQFNEVARVRNEKAPNDGDGQAFDCDLGAIGTNLFQYNYTHDNKGGVLIMMWENLPKTVIYRYNLSVNDDRQTNAGTQFPIHAIAGVNTAHVYNNVLYSTLPLGYKLKDNASTYFSNNIFHVTSGVYPSLTNFSNNCYFGHVADVNDPYKVTADPKFAGLLPTGAGADGFTPANVDMFKLQSSSPCINAGKAISAPIGNGGIDFWGNPLYAGTYADIGIHEVPGAGNPPPAAVTFADNVPGTAVVYTGGGWSHASDPLYYNGTKSLSATVGNYVRYTFTGTNVSLFGRVGPGLGKMNVSIDGGAPVLVDCYWGADLYRRELFRATNLANQAHTITVTVAAKNPLAAGNNIAVDYFQVLPVAPPAQPVVAAVDNPAGAAVAYSPGWTFTTGNTSFYGGTRAHSATIGNYVDFTFSGTGARIYGTKYASYGKLSVSIDGGPATVVNCFQPGLSYEYLVKLYEVNGLPNGTHTLRATIVAKDSLASGNEMSIDLFQSLTGGSATPVEVVLDNSDPSGITVSGSWVSSTFTPGFYGTNYINDNNTGKGSLSVRFRPTIPVAGTYQVFAWWTAASNRATNVPIDIVSNSGTNTVTVNQQLNGSQWVSLGNYNFAAGTTGSVLIRNGGTNGYVMADAVRFVKP